MKSALSSKIKTSGWLLLATMLLLQAGCATAPQSAHQATAAQQRPLTAQQREQALDTMQQFTLTASLGVKSATDNVSGNLSWQQNGAYYQAKLTNILGITVFDLVTSPDGVTVETDGKVHQADNASALLDYLSGWSLPIEEMQLWLRGLPGPSSEDLQYDAMGRLTGFTLLDSQQRRWQVRYTGFFADPLSLPQKMQLDSTDIRLKLKIKNWQ